MTLSVCCGWRKSLHCHMFIKAKRSLKKVYMNHHTVGWLVGCHVVCVKTVEQTSSTVFHPSKWNLAHMASMQSKCERCIFHVRTGRCTICRVMWPWSVVLKGYLTTVSDTLSHSVLTFSYFSQKAKLLILKRQQSIIIYKWLYTLYFCVC